MAEPKALISHGLLLAALATGLVSSAYAIVGFLDNFGQSWLVGAFAVSLQVSQYTVIGFFGRYGNRLTIAFKALVFLLLLVLMAGSAVGVYGALSSQLDPAVTAEAQAVSTKEADNNTKQNARMELGTIAATLASYDEQVARLPEDRANARARLLAAQKDQREALLARRDKLEQRLSQLNSAPAKTSADSGSHADGYKALAAAAGWPLATLLFWVKLTYAAVLEPMSLILFYLYNYTRRVGVQPADEPTAPLVPEPKVEEAPASAGWLGRK